MQPAGVPVPLPSSAGSYCCGQRRWDIVTHCTNKSQCPDRLPECIQHNRRTIRPTPLYRSRPFSGATRPRTPAKFLACSLLVVSVTASLRSLYIACTASCSLLARCLLVAADTSRELGRQCVSVGAVAPADTHHRPNIALGCFSGGGLRASLAAVVCQSVQ